MTRLQVRHRTTYTYRQAVAFGPHRLMCRPRDSHDLRLIDTTLSIEPAAATLRWLHDVFGNSIAIATFEGRRSSRLVFESGFRAEHFPSAPAQIITEPGAERFPVHYTADERADLGRTLEPHWDDPQQVLHRWALDTRDSAPNQRPLDVLSAMTGAIHGQFRYLAREEAGVQAPLLTLERGSGSCRDFAVLMIEAVRRLGLAARFVSGYLYPAPGADGPLVGGAATHAWVEVYLPGAGWIEFDPTNGLVGGRHLLRVAVARDPSQAAPLVGSFQGSAGAFLGLEVEVSVTTGE